MSIKDIQNKLFQSRLQAKKLFVKFYCNKFTYTFIYSLIVIKHKQITNDLPGGDLLLHAGDISSMGYFREIEEFCNWFNSLDNYDFKNFINNKYPYINLIKIKDTNGAVETLYLGIEYILNNYTYSNKSLIIDCDTFYREDIVSIFRESLYNMVFYTKNYDIDAKYSYIETTDEFIITNINYGIQNHT
jgi:hypothetical protein